MDIEQFKANMLKEPVIKQAELLKQIQDSIVELESQVSMLKVQRDALRYETIPTTMEQNGVESMRIAGLGTLSLTAEILVSTKQGMGLDLQDWFREHELGDLISEVVNASTLAGWVREQMKAGKADEIPTHLLNIFPRTRAAITKR